ncbi:AraC family transcriptional regulator [Scytonema hofmannii PCC 7110]|uniref:AraC family transcriptional regulator n=1 Tax=Scytonema hofmannii PCC 7110 TaxID=128403 RepID=A0A139XD25_9CYAN|nr:AraC family transcriptional regulator [Scytonema hofmannii]KYC42599.1 AraC family transcriptional regulator [Scytonema hofmannii PCC 7110]
MNTILVIDENSENKNLLMTSLKTAGFEVIDTEDGLVHVRLPQEKLSGIEENQELKASQSIFPSIPRLNKVFQFIELNYHQPIKLDDVAKEVGYASAYLSNLMRHLTGKTIIDWVIERRMAEARVLLLKTNKSVKQIALEVGYQNTNLFYYQFRDRHNSTPLVWRKAQRFQLEKSQKNEF